MSDGDESVFFYGLFMDEALLESKGIRPAAAQIGYVDGFSLHIGERATLLPDAGARAWGVLMQLDAGDVASLYSDRSVADYVAVPVVVNLGNGERIAAVCYNLPAEKLTGTNPTYAAALLSLARRLDLPDEYLATIAAAARHS